MTNAWTLVISSNIAFSEIEAVAIDDGSDIRVLPPAKAEAALRKLEIGPLRSPDFTLWTHDYCWTPDRHGTPLMLQKMPRFPELWAIDRAQEPTFCTDDPETDMKARQAFLKNADLLEIVGEDRAEVLATAPMLEPMEGGNPLRSIGLIRVGDRIETLMPPENIVNGNVDLSLLKRLASYDNAAKQLRNLLEMREFLR